jgi:hypothetical protein
MAARDLQFDDLSPLLAALCDGTISQEEFLRLEQILHASPRARAWYINYMDLHGELLCGQVVSRRAKRGRLLADPEWSATNLLGEEDADVAAPSGDEYAICSSPPSNVPRNLVLDEDAQEPDDASAERGSGVLVWCARQVVTQLSREGVLPWLAAVALFAAMVFGISRWELPASMGPVAGSDAQPLPAAWISLLHEVEWAPGQLPYGWGGAVMAGRTLRFNSGLVRLVFSSGAEVLLEGPAAFTAETAELGRLRLGKLVARAEIAQAQGFTIRTPTAQIVDFGTEFGVTVDEQGRTETFVFAGRVIAQAIGVKPTKSEPLRLEAGQAARVDSPRTGFRRVAAVPETFVRHPPPRQLRPDLHYTMEEPAGPLVDEQGSHKAREIGGQGFLYRQPGVPPGTYGAITIGPDGTGCSAGLNNATIQWELDAAGTARLNLANNFTVMAWLYLSAKPTGVVKIVGQSVTKPARGWAFGVREAGGGRGVFFAGGGIGEFYSGSSIPWTGGRWHHIAVTKSSAEGIRFYLDGCLVGADSRPAARDNLYRLGADELYSLGRGNDYVKEPGTGRRIDEFRVYRTVLTPEEIVLAAAGGP